MCMSQCQVSFVRLKPITLYIKYRVYNIMINHHSIYVFRLFSYMGSHMSGMDVAHLHKMVIIDFMHCMHLMTSHMQHMHVSID